MSNTRIMEKKEILKSFVIGTCFFCLITFLFYKQSVSDKTLYNSDLPTHILFAENMQGYSLLYFSMGMLLKIFHNTLSIAIFESIAVIMTCAIASKLIADITQLKKSTSFCLAILLTGLTSIYIPYIHPFFYGAGKGLITQPWHNITYIFMRFFGILTISFLHEIIKREFTDISWKTIISITISLTLSTMIKPNFFISFFPAFFMLYLFANRGKKLSVSELLRYGVIFVPSFIVCFVQSLILFDDNSSIVITLYNSKFLSQGFYAIILRLLCSLSVPLLIFSMTRQKNRKQRLMFYFLFLNFFVSLLYVILFQETGYRAAHGNFYWGLFFAGYVLFTYSLCLFLLDIRDNTVSYKYCILCSMLLMLHLISEIIYFWLLLQGKSYMI